MKSHRVIFLPASFKVSIEDGTSIQEAAHLAGIDIETICGGKGYCGKCKVIITEGSDHGIESSKSHLSSLSEAERTYADRYGLQPDERLACQAQVQGDVAVFVPEESRANIFSPQKTAGERIVSIKPAIEKCSVAVTPNFELEQLLSELENTCGLHDLVIDPHAQTNLSLIDRQDSKSITVTVWNDSEVIRIEEGNKERATGLALDIGTTTVAGYLCDLKSGRILATESMLNPQIRFGEDVMTRIAYAKDHSGGQEEMRSAIIGAVNELIVNVNSKIGITSDDISEMTVVGNTVMHHIFLGLDIVPLGLFPFAPAIETSINRKARDLGLEILPSANVHVLPIEAAFVGADNVGVMLAEDPYNQDEVLLIIDVGTNGELILGNRKQMFSASCATGPAFEGGNIKFGMRAAPGAIDRVRIDCETLDVNFSTIRGLGWSADLPALEKQSRGICGSGIIDVVAEMLSAGIIKNNGSFDKSITSSRLRAGHDGKHEFVVAWAEETAINKDIVVVQKDVRAIQLAMAAISTGAQMMLRRMGVDMPDKVILAGAFGAVINPRSALALGMFPDCGLENILVVGNAAGEGARIALLNRDKRIEADRVAREVQYIELTEEPGFNEAFVMATHFP